KCKRCDAVLVYHFAKKVLQCHYCGFNEAPPDICPKCRSGYIKYFGIGTEKVESELSRIFPQARFARMDTDSTAKRGSHDRILEEFKQHNIDVLVGTQMIAKGLDFPRVTLVGVVNADVTLNLPDFRASERTFGLLTQVAGRTGRGEGASEVIVQTYAPENYAIEMASRHDYEGFFKREIASRKLFEFPPYSKIIKFTFKASKEQKAMDAAEAFAKLLRRKKACKVLGPAPSPVARVRGQYRWNILARIKPQKDFSLQLGQIVAEFKRGTSRAFMIIDVDPIHIG
ncbi:MAG: primosomal protein N', partial [Candidatus Omnitrophota bacterium]